MGKTQSPVTLFEKMNYSFSKRPILAHSLKYCLEGIAMLRIAFLVLWAFFKIVAKPYPLFISLSPNRSSSQP